MFLYGVGSGAGAELLPEPVVHVGARIVETRWIEAGDSVSYDATYRAPQRRRIATIPIGYGDGYPRALGNRAVGVTRDAAVPIVGHVTMDMIMLDVTDSEADLGDEVMLIGAHEADVRTSVGSLAELAQMSPYELLTGLRGRLDRSYQGG
jgi:alanine racemase